MNFLTHFFISSPLHIKFLYIPYVPLLHFYYWICSPRRLVTLLRRLQCCTLLWAGFMFWMHSQLR